MTGLRCLILHGCIIACPDATAVNIWKTLMEIVEGHAPSLGSLQRNLNALVQRNILLRDVGLDRVWRYRVRPVSSAKNPEDVFDYYPPNKGTYV